MNADWEKVVKRLHQCPPKVNRFLPPCSRERIAEVEAQLGKLPVQINAMLSHFNGAELFIRHGPLITVFGISPIPPLGEFEWAQDWWIDKFTPAWRTARNREKDWVIAITSMDGISVLDDEGKVREWDRGESRWGPTDENVATWIERVLKEGEEYMSEPDGVS